MTYLGICVPGPEEIAGNPLKPVISHFPNPNQCDNRALPCCLVDVNTLMASSWRGSMSLLPCPHLGHLQPLGLVLSVRSRQSCHPPSRTQPMKPFYLPSRSPLPSLKSSYHIIHTLISLTQITPRQSGTAVEPASSEHGQHHGGQWRTYPTPYPMLWASKQTIRSTALSICNASCVVLTLLIFCSRPGNAWDSPCHRMNPHGCAPLITDESQIFDV